MHINLHFVQYCLSSLLYLALVFCACVCVYVCAIPSACLRSLLACILCCDCQDPLHPPDLDPPLPSSPTTTRSSLTPLHRAAERPQTTLPLPDRSIAPLGHWTVAVRGPLGVEAIDGRASIAGLSCSTLTPSEGMDMRQLLHNPRRQQRVLCSFCPRVVARWRRMNFNTWYDYQLLTARTFNLILIWSFFNKDGLLRSKSLFLESRGQNNSTVCYIKPPNMVVNNYFVGYFTFLSSSFPLPDVYSSVIWFTCCLIKHNSSTTVSLKCYIEHHPSLLVHHAVFVFYWNEGRV